MKEETQIKSRLIEVKINGFKWFVDDLKQKIYLDRNLNGVTGYSFLTPNERTQLRNFIDYGRKN
jgi:hypothetical protein